MEERIIETKSFHEVHKDLENEVLFLDKNHNINDFKEKANFLLDIGFNNSIATKIYLAISDNHSIINDYKIKYKNIYKFILEPQLERICEKYNLYVRPTEHFLGDIPEKNIKDIMGFSVYLDDLPLTNEHREAIISNLSKNVLQHPDTFGIQKTKIAISINDFKTYHLESLIEIASIKSLFSEKAFEFSNKRIIGNTEIEPKNQVDLDPIVLCKTKHGYLIITAWGDEANDELVFNADMN